LARELVESELFGHERGAFTGAVATHRGAFEQADGGTLFLDEIGELPLELQARLLRVLETWEVRRVGSESSVAVDVRLVCATHRDLRKLVHAETFREDLYYRLARLVVTVPPLRERPEDVEALADHFLREIENDVGKKVLSREARDRLLVYPWPGNARELRNVLSAAAASSPSGRIEWADIGRAMDRVAGPHCESRQGSTPHAALHQVLEQHRGNVSAAARTLGMPRSTLRDRLRGLARTGPPAGAPEDRASGEGG
jgi:DNA-binding NtrC family response regulator